MKEPYLEVTFRQGRAIGIEITAPSKLSLGALNAVLDELGHDRASQIDLAPLIAA